MSSESPNDYVSTGSGSDRTHHVHGAVNRELPHHSPTQESQSGHHGEVRQATGGSSPRHMAETNATRDATRDARRQDLRQQLHSSITNDLWSWRQHPSPTFSVTTEDDYINEMPEHEVRQALRTTLRQTTTRDAPPQNSDLSDIRKLVQNLHTTLPQLRTSIDTINKDVQKLAQEQTVQGVKLNAIRATPPLAQMTSTMSSSAVRPKATLSSLSTATTASTASRLSSRARSASPTPSMATQHAPRIVTADLPTTHVKSIENETRTKEQEWSKTAAMVEILSKLVTSMGDTTEYTDLLNFVQRHQDEQHQQVQEQYLQLQRAQRLKRQYEVNLPLPQTLSTRYLGSHEFLHPKTIQAAIGTFTSGEHADFTTTWKKILLYGRDKCFTEENYISILTTVVKGTAEEDLIDMVDRGSSLSQILEYFAQQYTQRRTIDDHVRAVEQFARKPNEPITVCVSRARQAMMKVQDMMEPHVWPIYQEKSLQGLLRHVIDSRTRAHLVMKERTTFKAGIGLSVEAMINLIDIYEQAHNTIPTSAMPAGMSLTFALPITTMRPEFSASTNATSIDEEDEQNQAADLQDQIHELQDLFIAALSPKGHASKRPRHDDKDINSRSTSSASTRRYIMPKRPSERAASSHSSSSTDSQMARMPLSAPSTPSKTPTTSSSTSRTRSNSSSSSTTSTPRTADFRLRYSPSGRPASQASQSLLSDNRPRTPWSSQPPSRAASVTSQAPYTQWPDWARTQSQEPPTRPRPRPPPRGRSPYRRYNTQQPASRTQYAKSPHVLIKVQDTTYQRCHHLDCNNLHPLFTDNENGAHDEDDDEEHHL